MAQGSKDRRVTFLLTTATRGSEESQPLVIPKNVKSVQLLIDQPAGEYENSRASPSTVEGKEIRSQRLQKLEAAKTSEKIKLTVPANQFGNQDYILRILGANSAAEPDIISQYYFRVVIR